MKNIILEIFEAFMYNHLFRGKIPELAFCLLAITYNQKLKRMGNKQIPEQLSAMDSSLFQHFFMPSFFLFAWGMKGPWSTLVCLCVFAHVLQYF